MKQIYINNDEQTFTVDEGDVVNTCHAVEIEGPCKMQYKDCLLYTSPSPRDVEESRMPSSA